MAPYNEHHDSSAIVGGRGAGTAGHGAGEGQEKSLPREAKLNRLGGGIVMVEEKFFGKIGNGFRWGEESQCKTVCGLFACTWPYCGWHPCPATVRAGCCTMGDRQPTPKWHWEFVRHLQAGLFLMVAWFEGVCVRSKWTKSVCERQIIPFLWVPFWGGHTCLIL